jgi:hypothetical protein
VGSHGIVPPHRLAAHFMGLYQGKPLFTWVPLPDEGPVPTMAQLEALHKERAAQASAKADLAAR